MNSASNAARDASYTTRIRRLRAVRALHNSYAERAMQVPSQDSIRDGLTAQEVIELKLSACACSCDGLQCGGTRLDRPPACSGC